MASLYEITKRNPFCALGAVPSDSRKRLIEKQKEIALFGDSENGEQALNALLLPQSRLEAEIHWFPCTERAEIDRMMNFIMNPGTCQPIPPLRTESFLARFNALRMQLSLFPAGGAEDLKALIHSLSIAGDALLPRLVMEELNRDREKSGFARLEDVKSVDSSITSLLRETVQAHLAERAELLKKQEFASLKLNLQNERKDRKSRYHNSLLLDIAAEELTLMQ